MTAPTVLIVEDNLLNRRLFREVLSLEGYGVIEAEDGEAALEAARDGRPALILMDLQLPRRSGLDAARALKRAAPLAHIPVIAVTALARPSDAREARRAGCDGYLAKPVTPDALLAAVRDHLPEPAPRGAPGG